MNWKRNQWMIGCIAVLVTLGVLAGGQYIWKQYAVSKPLDKVFSGIAGVENVTWDENSKSGDVAKIDVTLKNVSDLQKTYQALTEGSKQILGRKNFVLTLHDNRNAELEGFYHSIHFAIHEGISTGNFTAMSERLQEKASVAGINLRSQIDAKNIYIQMSQGNVEMYVVIARTPMNGEVK